MITKNPKNILIAENSNTLAGSTTEVLLSSGHKVNTYTNGLQVIEALKSKKHKIDILILDLYMPNVDGFMVLEWINKYYDKNFPILCLQGPYSLNMVESRIKALGVSTVIPGNSAPHEIISTVNSCLFEHKGKQRKEQRKNLLLPAEIKVQDLTKTGEILNLSTKGLFFRTSHDFNVESDVSIHFRIPKNTHSHINAEGRIKWSASGHKHPDLFSGVGVELSPLSDADRLILNDFLS